MKMRYIWLVSFPVLLGACTSEWDMQGKDPKDFYKEHPIANKVETRSQSYSVQFAAGSNRLSGDQIDALFAAISEVAPAAVESVQVQMHASQIQNTARREHLMKLLHHRGYSRHALLFERSDTVGRNEARINISYAKVVSPRCPDWRTSSVTTYSNTQQGGFGCANVTNLGLMVADPRDLQKGPAAVSPDAERNWNVLTPYHANKPVGGSANAGADSGTTSDPSSSTQSAPQ